jgi:DNA (cytosine-5)-methyltransferase 1
MRHGSLFSGIGGFDLASEWMGWENVFHCEWNEFGQKVLKYYWPKAITYNDITKTDFTIHRGEIDIITGGFPCQPFSIAGKRKGESDERFLWFEMLRAIQQIKPQWVVAENVTNITTMENGSTFEKICSSLENEGYEVQSYIIPAGAVGAWHKRNRIWILAYNSSLRIQRNNKKQIQKQSNLSKIKDGRIFQEIGKLSSEIKPFFSGAGNGISTRLYNDIIKSFGNAIVPQVAYNIFQSIEQYETTRQA